ncbi:MAG TPA: MerR family transcriptional regulator [Chloroflexia bacterium]|nr:MerR family transcriptional regulator [Chloroflexia bacterium]
MEQKSYSLKELCQVAGVTERTVRYYIKEGLLPPPTGAGPFSRYSYEHYLRLSLIRRLKDEFLPLSEIKNLLDGKNVEELDSLARRNGLLDEKPESNQPFKDENRLESFLQPDQASSLRQQLAGSSPPVMSSSVSEVGADYKFEMSEPDMPLFSVADMDEEEPDFPVQAAPIYPASAPPRPVPSAPAGFQPPMFRQSLSRSEERVAPEPRMMAMKSSMPPAPPAFKQNAPETEQPIGQQWERIVIAPGVELHVERSVAREQRGAIMGLLQLARQLLGGNKQR